MMQPPGFEDSSFPTHVCRLQKALYGLKQLPRACYFLGIEVTRLPHVLHLNQQRYIHQLLECADLLGAKSTSTPVNQACQYMAHPTTSHLQAAKRILRYLKGTATHGLSIHATPSWSLQGCIDADWASCPNDRRSTNGFCLFFSTNLISWSSTKQHVISRTSTESEYRTLALLVVEHIEIDLHFVRDKVLRKELLIQYVPSIDQLADVFTKHVPSCQFSVARTRLSVVPIPVSLRGDDKQHPHQQLILLLSNQCCYD
ncbi:putative mitochondrial protein [Vitis vinifera]|uniref:Putative mitochondrial protein n=1 Tax=Vitis vinifera TaxID=29760 RepID=A0A438ECM7_VITVI|nr:putative mitochondrial protein [Vitis vinifera]